MALAPSPQPRSTHCAPRGSAAAVLLEDGGLGARRVVRLQAADGFVERAALGVVEELGRDARRLGGQALDEFLAPLRRRVDLLHGEPRRGAGGFRACAQHLALVRHGLDQTDGVDPVLANGA
jgi:hypothetical protein